MAFLDEILQNSTALRNMIGFYRTESGARLLENAARLASRRPRSLAFAGMGTSEFVPIAVRDYLSDRFPAPVVIWEAGELLHHGIDGVRSDDVVVAISQSGESIETRSVVERLRELRALITITNNPESTMARVAKLNLPMLAGEEASISNKTYVNSLAVVLLLSRALAGEDIATALDGIMEAARKMDTFASDRRGEIERAAELLRDARTVYFVSRGPAMAAARQAALTFQEGAHVFTTAMPGGSMRHGPFEIVGSGHHAIMFAPEGHGGDLVRSMAREMAELGSKVVLMTAVELEGHRNMVSIVLKPGSPELFSLACAVPQELLLVRMASDRGWTAGVFRCGGKVTSRE